MKKVAKFISGIERGDFEVGNLKDATERKQREKKRNKNRKRNREENEEEEAHELNCLKNLGVNEMNYNFRFYHSKFVKFEKHTRNGGKAETRKKRII